MENNLFISFNIYINKFKIQKADQSQFIDTRAKESYSQYSIPNSINIPYNLLLNTDNTYKTKEEIQQIIEEYKINSKGKIITYCGIGLSACVLNFALEEILGLEKIKLYSGSMEEYIMKSN